MENKKINLYNIRYKNSMKPIDWSYYTKFFPDRDRAVQALCMDTDLKKSEANDVVTEIFGRLKEKYRVVLVSSRIVNP